MVRIDKASNIIIYTDKNATTLFKEKIEDPPQITETIQLKELSNDTKVLSCDPIIFIRGNNIIHTKIKTQSPPDICADIILVLDTPISPYEKRYNLFRIIY
jgi:hypothetical protein